VQHSPRSYFGTLHELIVRTQPPPELASLEQPVWLIAGDRDPIVDVEFLARLASRPRIRLEIWSGTHDLPLTDPARCVAAIRQLVALGERR